MNNKEFEEISYKELARRVGVILLCNNITQVDENLWDNLENGELEFCYEHDTKTECNKFNGNDCAWESYEIYQYYLIDKFGADYLKRNTNEIVFYCEPLDLWVWGITHFGTSWEAVFTSIKDKEND